MFTVGYTEGYLHKNYMGQWYPVCTTNDSWVRDACVSEIGPDMRYVIPFPKISSTITVSRRKIIKWDKLSSESF